MYHHPGKGSLLERLRSWCVANPDQPIRQAKKELRKQLSESDIDQLFEDWLNSNFERIEVKKLSENSHTAIIRESKTNRDSPADRAKKKLERDRIVSRIAGTVKANMFESFASHIWETILPNGIVLKDAKGKDLQHATGWYKSLAKLVGPTEKLMKKFSTRQLFDLSQRS
jgi:hypothetical protein